VDQADKNSKTLILILPLFNLAALMALLIIFKEQN
jgi:hypothetical protein